MMFNIQFESAFFIARYSSLDTFLTEHQPKPECSGRLHSDAGSCSAAGSAPASTDSKPDPDHSTADSTTTAAASATAGGDCQWGSASVHAAV